MSGYPFTGPTAPESNPPIEPQFFAPSEFTITAISLGITTTVTTATSPFGVANNYVIGQQVRFIIPSTYGTRQLNERTGYVIGIPGLNQVIVNIDTSRNYDSFITSPSYGPTPPQLLPIGDVNSGVISSTGRSVPTTTIPGSFINTSPVASG
jgi:hypothetical protein